MATFQSLKGLDLVLYILCIEASFLRENILKNLDISNQEKALDHITTVQEKALNLDLYDS